MARFLNFWGKKRFSMKSSCYAQLLNGLWHHEKIQRKLMIQFQENTGTDIWRQDGQTLFHRTLSATASDLISKTEINWHLKVKYIEYKVGLNQKLLITVQSACKKIHS